MSKEELLRPYTEEEQKEKKESCLRNIAAYKRYTEDGNYYYRPSLQGVEFDCAYTDEELDAIADYSLEITEILKEIVREKMDDQITRVIREEGPYALGDDADVGARLHGLVTVIKELYRISPRLEEIVEFQIPRTCRVGGAWWMILVRPSLLDLVHAVFDSFMRADEMGEDNPADYAVYFLMRGIMKLHSSDVTEEKK